MKCPACSNLENRVIDSRLNKEGNSTRRRRECLSCNERFTTYERIEKSVLTELVVTDTIPLKQECNKITVLPIANLFSDVINKVHNFESISSHFIF